MSNPDILRMPASPRWDPESRLNPFTWIVATAPKVRAARQDAEDDYRHGRRQQQRIDNQPVKP